LSSGWKDIAAWTHLPGQRLHMHTSCKEKQQSWVQTPSYLHPIIIMLIG
jgi:hypothetical protein